MRQAVGGLVVAALIVVLAGAAHGAVLCRRNNKSRLVTLRDEACTKKETAIDLAQLGALGPPGPPGGFTPENISLVNGPVTIMPRDFPGGSVPQSTATCPEGAVAIAGFWRIDGAYYAEPAPFINSSRQQADPRSWTVVIQLSSSYPGTDISYHAVAVCAAPSP